MKDALGISKAMEEFYKKDSIIELGPKRRYKLLSKLGSGGFAFVLKAEKMSTLEEVALKCFYSIGGAESGERYDRFVREAGLTKIVGDRAENVVKVVDVGLMKSSRSEIKLPCIALEYIPGPSLDVVNLLRAGSYSLKEVCVVSKQIARALAEIHSQGIVHRDLKPSNVLIHETEGIAKLTDLGIAFDFVAPTNLTMPIDQSGKDTMYGTVEYFSHWHLRDDEVNRKDGEDSFGRPYIIENEKPVFLRSDGTKLYRRFHGPQMDLTVLTVNMLMEMLTGRNPIVRKTDVLTVDVGSTLNAISNLNSINLEDEISNSSTLKSIKSREALAIINYVVNRGLSKGKDEKKAYFYPSELIADLERAEKAEYGKVTGESEEREVMHGLLSRGIQKGMEDKMQIIRRQMESLDSGDRVTKHYENIRIITEIQKQIGDRAEGQQFLKEYAHYTEGKLRDPNLNLQEIDFLYRSWYELCAGGEIGGSYIQMTSKIKRRLEEKGMVIKHESR